MTEITATKRDWKLITVVAVAAVAFASMLSLVAIRTVRVTGTGPVPSVSVSVPVKTPTPGPVRRTAGGLEGEETVTDGKTYFKVTRFNPATKSGTLTFIAAQYGTTVAQLVAWNKIQDPDVINIGQKLRVK